MLISDSLGAKGCDKRKDPKSFRQREQCLLDEDLRLYEQGWINITVLSTQLYDTKAIETSEVVAKIRSIYPIGLISDLVM